MAARSGQSVYDTLYAAIASGEIGPGERLRETELAERTGASRTPVREAIRQLEADGIVEHKPRVGAVVKSLSQQEIVELYEMRIVLETTAAEMAAKHISAAEIRALKALNAEMLASSNQPQRVSELNQQFHTCIMNAARNRFLLASFRSLARSLIVLGHTTLDAEDRVALVVGQHDTVIAALEKADAAAASAAMRVHMETSLDHRLAGLR